MKNPVSPTHTELEVWCRTDDAMYPMEDWDLIVATSDNAGLFVRLAADKTCVGREAALNFLYVFAGQVVREGSAPSDVSALRQTISLAQAASDEELDSWAKRAIDVLDGNGPDPRPNASREDYMYWFGTRWRELP